MSSSLKQEPAYKAISRSKLAHLEARIPQEWRLSPQWIPAGMLTPEESIANLKYDPINVMDIPRKCGLLSTKELEITEKWDVRGLLGEIAGGRLSARDASLAFCKRAAISHQLTRCLTEPLFKEALNRASQLDEHIKRTGKPIGPLHGLPVSVKDTFDIKGVDTTVGVAGLANKPATQDAVLVQLLHHLGAVIIAKTNVPQTMLALDSVNYLFGRTLNPLNRQLTAGGSSGGEGVLVAMRGSMVGFGTDIGGSIRVPAMCTGIYGFKPDGGRVPFGGQMGGSMTGRGRIAIATVAGPIARSVADIDVIMKEIVPRAEVWGEDGIPGQWPSITKPKRKFTIGVLRSDGLVQPLPPIAKILDEVAQTLARDKNIEVVEIPVPKALAECQRLAGQLMYVDGGSMMMDLMDLTKEPFVPWLQGRVQRSPPMSVPKLLEIQHRRAEVEREMMKMWTTGSQDPYTRRVDAIIHPVAPHPIPELDRYNATGYTSSWVLLDCPAGVIPVRNLNESDLELEKEMNSKVIGSWDKRNRELWDSKTVDRRVYLNSPLSIQVITPKHHDHDLCVAMDIIDRALGEDRELRAGKTNAVKL